MKYVPITLLVITTLIAIVYSSTVTSTTKPTEHWGPFDIENFGQKPVSVKKKPPVNAVLKT